MKPAQDLVVKTRNEISRLLQRFKLENSLPGDHPYSTLSTAELSLVLTLGDRGTQRMSALATYLGVPLTTATSIADRLYRKTLMVRNASERDRRVVLAELTAKGRDLYQIVFETQLHQTDQMLRCLNSVERKQFLDCLLKMTESALTSSKGGR